MEILSSLWVCVSPLCDMAMAAHLLTSTLGLGLCVPLLINTCLCPCTAPGRFAEATVQQMQVWLWVLSGDLFCARVRTCDFLR